MRIICVDDTVAVLEETVRLCRSLPQAREVHGFSRSAEALDWIRTHAVDLAILDIHMPEINGLKLAEELKCLQPDASVIFLTAFPHYAVQAFKVRATGYLLKPVDRDSLAEEIAYAFSRMPCRAKKRVVVKTFGSFEIFVDGKTLPFHRSKSKELLAYLIDSQGKGVNRPTISAALFENKLYNHSQQKYLDVIIRSLRDTLREAGAEDILELRSGFLRIVPEKVDCDLYRFLENDPEAVGSYRGEYMRDYEWALLNSQDLRLLR